MLINKVLRTEMAYYLHFLNVYSTEYITVCMGPDGPEVFKKGSKISSVWFRRLLKGVIIRKGIRLEKLCQ